MENLTDEPTVVNGYSVRKDGLGNIHFELANEKFVFESKNQAERFANNILELKEA